MQSTKLEQLSCPKSKKRDASRFHEKHLFQLFDSVSLTRRLLVAYDRNMTIFHTYPNLKNPDKQ